ncbi:conserved hypothetical protein [Sinorhizobium medicae]|uniref:Uncharacterized protein n=1 Tax=Sinorhizobium medicae TaxID=110321 RepID=A0A508WRG8_9HYPH|nr:conserved hypothetical protein [Sinorhizobium medicae]
MRWRNFRRTASLCEGFVPKLLMAGAHKYPVLVTKCGRPGQSVPQGIHATGLGPGSSTLFMAISFHTGQSTLQPGAKPIVDVQRPRL